MKNAEMVTLTPKLAAEWKATVKPDAQRKYRDHHALKLARAIERGEWTRNNDMFMFDKDGALVNGQHRCGAVMKANKSIVVTVAYDCTEDEIMHADQGGLPRRSDDALHYAGFAQDRNIAAIINTIQRDIEGERFAPSADQCIAFAVAHRDALYEANRYWYRGKQMRCPVEPSILCAVYFVAAQTDKAAAESFVTAVTDNVPKMRQDGAWHVIKRFKQNSEMLTGKMNRRTKVALVIKGYNAWKDGKTLPFLRWSPGQGEAFPEIK